MVESLAVVDVSPVNRSFDVTDATEWNMEHFFHAMLAVEFKQDANMSECRKVAFGLLEGHSIYLSTVGTGCKVTRPLTMYVNLAIKLLNLSPIMPMKSKL